LTLAEPVVGFPVKGLEGSQDATTIPLAAVAAAVKIPELVMVPAVAGLTDQTTENPCGGLGEALNVVVDPAATVTEEGLTASLTGKGLGFGKPFSEAAPPPHAILPGRTKASPMEMTTRSLLGFRCEAGTASGLIGRCAILVLVPFSVVATVA
jgi:hypothetical protein